MALVGLVFLPLTVGLVRLSDTFQRAPLARNEGREQTSTSATPDTAGQKSYTRREVLRDGVFYAVLPLALFTPFVFTGLIIHQNLLLEAKQWSTSLFAAAFLGFGLTRFGANILVGILVDRFSARRVFVFSQLPFGFGLMVLAVFEPGWAAWVFLGLAGVSASAGALTTGALWAELYGGAYLGSIKSMAATAMVLSTAAASSLLVYFMQSPERLETMLWITAGLSAVLSAIAGRALTQRFLRPKHEAPVSRIG
jgi:MFS family permease